MGMTREEMLAVLEKRYGNREPQRQEPTLAEIADMTTWEQQTHGTTEDHELAVQGL